MRNLALLSVLVLAASACGSGSNPSTDAPSTADADTTNPPDADNTGWTRLIGRTWTVAAGTEEYKCTRIRVDTDVYVQGFRAQAPLGSHHSVLTMANSNSGSLGDYDCSVGTLDLKMLYASGVGTDDLVFPTDVGVLIPAGTYLNLNLHLFNASDTEMITGDSAVLVKTLPAAPPTLADMTFAGDVSLNIPNDGLPHDETGGCGPGGGGGPALNRDYTVVALWPHMHQYATHQKVELTHGGVTTTVLDDDYSFSNQRNYPQAPPLQFAQGDGIHVTCTYVNNGPGTIQWGDSSTAEMCFVGIYRYPAGGTLFDCINGIPPL